jgi:hypothetical protein
VFLHLMRVRRGYWLGGMVAACRHHHDLSWTCVYDERAAHALSSALEGCEVCRYSKVEE